MTGRPVDEYVEAEVQRLLTEDSGLAEQGITVRTREQTLVLSGEVASAQRRDEILRRIREHFPGLQVQADIGLTCTQPPRQTEHLT